MTNCNCEQTPQDILPDDYCAQFNILQVGEEAFIFELPELREATTASHIPIETIKRVVKEVADKRNEGLNND